MRFGKGTALAAVITLAVIILNGAVFYSVYCSGDVLQSRDIYGNVYQANRSDIAAQQSLLDSLTGNKADDTVYLGNNISLLEDYLAAAEYIAGNTNSLNNIDGETADWNVDQGYWALYVGEEYGTNGVDTTPIHDGDTFKLVYTIG